MRRLRYLLEDCAVGIVTHYVECIALANRAIAANAGNIFVAIIYGASAVAAAQMLG